MSDNVGAALLGAIVGAMISAWLTHLTASNTKRRDLCLQFFREYLTKQNDYSNVKYLLEHPGLCLESEPNADQNYNLVMSFGDWLEMFSACYERNLLDRGLAMDLGLREVADNFAKDVANSIGNMAPSETHWRHLRDVSNMHYHR